MIVGLTGTNASGKDTVADYLKNHGFTYHSCSDILRDELTAKGKPITREDLIEIGKEMRETQGNGILAKKILMKIKKNDEEYSLVVSIRHPDEVAELKKEPSFRMMMIDAPLDVRYKRVQSRGRPEDKVTMEQFVQHERMEHQTEGSGQQLGRVAKMADVTIMNDSTLEGLYRKIDFAIDRWRKET